MIKSIDIKNNKIEYIEFGNGDIPFIIIPGLGARSVLGFEDAIKNQYSILSNKYHVYLIERPLLINAGVRVNDISEMYYDAMIKLNIKNPIIYGNSMGGMIGLNISLNHKDYVSKLILASSCSRVDEYSKSVFNKWYELSLTDLYKYNKEMVNDIYSLETINKFKEALITPYMDLTFNELENFRHQATSLCKFDLYNELTNLKTDLYFIGSTSDNVFKLERYLELKPYTKGFYLYDGYSHMVCDEAPDFLVNVIKMLGE